MLPRKEKGTRKCEWLERAADDPKTRRVRRRAERVSHRSRAETFSDDLLLPVLWRQCSEVETRPTFSHITKKERQRLVALTKDMRTIEDVTRAFGEPDIRQPVGMVIIKPERDGKPETTQSYPELIYTKLSDIADVHVAVYRTDRVGISFIPRLLLIGVVTVLMSGCGVTLSPVKRKPLQVSPMETSLRPVSDKVLVRFESTLPGQQLAETVWDNVSGPFVDAVESKQIGYTQGYSTLIPATVAGGTVEGAAVATQPKYTRIVIPFGRIFEKVFESGLQKVFPNSFTCSDAPSESEKLRSAAPRHVVRLKVEQFRVWEKPLNHINLSAVVECRVYRAGFTNEPSSIYEAHHHVSNRSIGSIASTSSGVIREVNKISNKFAGDLSEEILGKLQKKLGE